jgi:hypothetical protein
LKLQKAKPQAFSGGRERKVSIRIPKGCFLARQLVPEGLGENHLLMEVSFLGARQESYPPKGRLHVI